ncbi:hypothetical protein [Vibrio sp. D431a]|uniref:hypothetical protein n=1 Tax=Vibrio sp. D431a TaxID=2837388 RepID=UPI0025525546|nr:hypothetical protein [Vibrio sp. D431a]MDK9793825.1 hypothetical protein [Vibrio sp. D431a]
MIKLHSGLVILSIVITFCVSGTLLSRDSVNPDVFVQSFNNDLKKAPVTYEPYLDPNALGRNLKDNLNMFLSYSISSPRTHINNSLTYFSPDYQSYIYSYMTTAIGNLKLQNVRVVDFIVTKDPVFIGSEVGLDSNWTYFVEGYFSYQGIFSKKKSISEHVSLFIKIKKDEPTSKNPLGVGIYNIVGLPNF